MLWTQRILRGLRQFSSRLRMMTGLAQNWEEAVLCLLACRGRRRRRRAFILANPRTRYRIPEAPPPPILFQLNAMVIGLVTSAERLIQVQRNRAVVEPVADTDYVNGDKVRLPSSPCPAYVCRQ
jgi:hypothetical protein